MRIEKDLIEGKFDIVERNLRFRRAEDYSEMFKILEEEDVIGKGLATKLEDMARFRNLLVHRYGEIDNERVLEMVKHNLGDIQEFENEIARFIEHE